MIPKVIRLPMLMDNPQILVMVRNVKSRKLQANHQIYPRTAGFRYVQQPARQKVIEYTLRRIPLKWNPKGFDLMPSRSE